MIYEGSPSWKAYLGHYILAVLGAIVLIAILRVIARRRREPRRPSSSTSSIPLAVAVVFGFGVDPLPPLDQVPRHRRR